MPSTQLQNTLASEEQKLLACIHCGLCLEACPTYVVTGDENDGPRGRLYLMRAVGEGRLNNDSKSFKTHIDRCLGCRACEQVCPAGVEYGQLLEAARAEIVTTNADKSGFANAVLSFMLRHVWPHPRRLRMFFAATRLFRNSRLPHALIRIRLAGLLSRRVEFALALLENSRPTNSVKALPSHSRERGGASVLLFRGCVGEGLFEHVNRATARVLEANGFSVEVPERQVCCGALHAHAGDLDGARDLARKNIHAFRESTETPIVTNAGGCGAMLVSYKHLFAHDDDMSGEAAAFSSRVRDVGQQLEGSNLFAAAAITTDVVTYDASCHLLYGQHAADASLRMVRSIADLKFVELRGSERCCGAAGVYNLLQPEMSGRVLQEKLRNLADCGADIVTTGNPGCQMQIGAGACLAGMNVKVRHPVELLDDAYAQAGLYSKDGI